MFYFGQFYAVTLKPSRLENMSTGSKSKAKYGMVFRNQKKQYCQLAEHQGRSRGCNFVCSKSAPYHSLEMHEPLARYVILRVVHEPGTFTPRRFSDPDMHHGLCVTHVPWCIPGSLTSGCLWSQWREKWSLHSRRVCATHNLTYLVRGPLQYVGQCYKGVWIYQFIQLTCCLTSFDFLRCSIECNNSTSWIKDCTGIFPFNIFCVDSLI